MVQRCFVAPAVAVLLLLTLPLRTDAQGRDDREAFTFRGIPWTASFSEVRSSLEVQGWRYVERMSGPREEYLFAPPDEKPMQGFVHVLMGSGGPVSVGTLISLNDFNRRQLEQSIEQAVESFTRDMGSPPDEADALSATWAGSDQTAFKIYVDTMFADQLDALRFETRGPGFGDYAISQYADAAFHTLDDSRWKTVSVSETARVSLDTKRSAARDSAGQSMVWVRIDFRAPQGEPVPHTHTLEQLTIDCEAMRLRVLNRTRWNDQEIVQESSSAESWQVALPETLGEGIIFGLCEGG